MACFSGRTTTAYAKNCSMPVDIACKFQELDIPKVVAPNLGVAGVNAGNEERIGVSSALSFTCNVIVICVFFLLTKKHVTVFQQS